MFYKEGRWSPPERPIFATSEKDTGSAIVDEDARCTVEVISDISGLSERPLDPAFASLKRFEKASALLTRFKDRDTTQ
jgi:hypothetical protein